MFRFACTFGVIALLTACGASSATTAGRGTGSRQGESFPLSATGWSATPNGIEVDVDLRCVRTAGDTPCDPPARTVRFIAITPWATSLEGRVDDKRAATLPLARTRVVFAVDWAAVGIDPLIPGGTDKLAGRWTLAALGVGAELRWTPSKAEHAALAAQVGEAIGIEEGVRSDLPPPKLEVGALEVDRGDPPALRLTVTNAGTGPAFRVYARTRSSEPALHGLQISFGRVDPGATETRGTPVTLPVRPRRPTATVVIEFYEANAHFPDPASRHVQVGPQGPAPSLSLACSHDGARIDEVPLQANAGARLRLECTLRNAGDAAAKAVRLGVAVGEKRVGTTDPVDLAPAQSQIVVVSVRVPGNATPEQPVPIAIQVEQPGVQLSLVERGSIQVRMPALCPDGRLTREQYEKKRATFEEAARSGHLTQEEFERYDAELVGCLQ